MERLRTWTRHLIGSSGTDPVILEIDLDRGILSAAPEHPLAAYRAINTPSMRDLRDGLREAARDDRVRGLIVHIGSHALSATQTDELGDLIEEFGESRPTVAYTEGFGEFANGVWPYRLACRARTLWMQPTGLLSLGGVHLTVTLLRGGLEKLGVTPEFGQRKEYKTAGDRFAAREVTAANREMMTRLGQSLMDDTVALVARRRSLEPAAVWDAVDQAPLTATQAHEQGFVDHLGYRDEVYAAVREEWDVPRTADDPGLLFVHRYAPHGPWKALDRLRDRKRPSVGVVTVRGNILTGRGEATMPGQEVAASGVVCDRLRAATEDDTVRAVILRVESPGGSALASDEIWRAVRRLGEVKPVIASMGNVAASGGYYVSMGAHEIVAHPSTLTGSIGVVAGKFVTQGLYDKLGLVREGIDIGARAGMLAAEHGFTDEEWGVLNRLLDDIYRDFTTKAAEGRNMLVEELEPLARGRVWTGSDAQERGLVDHLGGVAMALKRACALADLDESSVNLRAVGSTSLLARIRPAESTEAANAMVTASASPLEPLGALVATLGQSHPIESLLARLGAPGILSLPWSIHLG